MAFVFHVEPLPASEQPTDRIDPETGAVIEVLPRREIHAAGHWHPTVHVWIAMAMPPEMVMPGETGIWLLFQRHPHWKAVGGGRLGASCAGHLSAGEAALDGAVRELKEELGLALVAERLSPLFERRVERAVERGFDREVQQVFGAVVPLDWYELDFDFEEVLSLAAFPVEELARMLTGRSPVCKGSALVPMKADERAIFPVMIEREMFLDADDEYLAHVVAWAARLDGAAVWHAGGSDVLVEDAGEDAAEVGSAGDVPIVVDD